MSVKTELMRSEKCVNHKTENAIIRIVNDTGARNIRAGVPLCKECVKEIAEFYKGVAKEEPVVETVVDVTETTVVTPVEKDLREGVDGDVEKQEEEKQFEEEPEKETQKDDKEESGDSEVSFLDQLDLGGE